jgi:RNA polymerase sigma factor (sigma-70 family)
MPASVSNDDYIKYLPLFKSICRKYVRPGVEMEDLLQMAYFGLHDAVKKYKEDNESGASFTTFLYGCVRNAVLEGLSTPGAYGMFPVYALRQEKYSALKGTLSLDAPSSADNDSTLLDGLIADDEGLLNRIELDELRRDLWPIVEEVLNDRAYKIIRGHHAEGRTFVELAEVLNEPVGRIKAVCQRGLEKLRFSDDINQLAQDYGIHRHVSLREFKRTHTSSVEAEVLYREERREGKHGAGFCEEVL